MQSETHKIIHKIGHTQRTHTEWDIHEWDIYKWDMHRVKDIDAVRYVQNKTQMEQDIDIGHLSSAIYMEDIYAKRHAYSARHAQGEICIGQGIDKIGKTRNRIIQRVGQKVGTYTRIED